ncbi:DUF885 family protein [Acetonema longum]|uniref:DUF885 domain-containing protein n=1 Tax=Acetonema longum DSM 6540 TaxID=1009370 RepID=F7NJE6_9FIRM|nr:DUF885 family protein [Acetonema longum]EGO63894.1 hypothetical protein ALO_11009 [Acetonema longum DSM 6540]
MSAYDSITQKFHAYFTRDANACVTLGVDKHLDELPDPSLAASQANVREGNELLAEIRHVPREDLDCEKQLDLDLAALEVEYSVFGDTCRFNGKPERFQMPTAGEDISNGLFLLFVSDPRPAAERLDNITCRLEKVPDYLDGLLGRLDTPVKRWRDVDEEKVRELPDLFATVSQWARQESYPGLARLNRAREKAETALSDYLHRLQAMPVTGQFAVGLGQTREIIRLRGIEKSMESLKSMARDFLAENAATVEELRAKLAAKYKLDKNIQTVQLQQYLNKQYQVDPGKDGSFSGILQRYEAERGKILQFIAERDLFPVPADQDMLIIRTPGFMQPSIPAGAMMSPPPFRAGVRRSIIYLTLGQELLDEHTELSIPVMLIHEGIPGHHLQFAAAASHPSVIRRHLNAMDQAEGWTTMLEDYMLDQGYMGDLTDEARFICQRDIARLGARVAIDLYFMTGDPECLDVGVETDLSDPDPFVNAGRLLDKVTGFTPARAQGELNWYSQDRGYPLSYLTGNRLVWKLKRDLAKARRGKEEGLALDRLFHQVYLSAGAMPVSYLRRVFQNQGLL